MKEFKQCTMEEVFDLVGINVIYINAMIYNFCDHTRGKCPISKTTCNRACSENFLAKQKKKKLKRILPLVFLSQK